MQPCGGRWEVTVFPVPDATVGFKEKLMIAYPSNFFVNYFFFDGESPAYGEGSVQTGVSGIRSVRLFAGTAEGYTNNKYVIQVFLRNSFQQWRYVELHVSWGVRPVRRRWCFGNMEPRHGPSFP